MVSWWTEYFFFQFEWGISRSRLYLRTPATHLNTSGEASCYGNNPAQILLGAIFGGRRWGRRVSGWRQKKVGQSGNRDDRRHPDKTTILLEWKPFLVGGGFFPFLSLIFQNHSTEYSKIDWILNRFCRDLFTNRYQCDRNGFIYGLLSPHCHGHCFRWWNQWMEKYAQQGGALSSNSAELSSVFTMRGKDWEF